MRRSPFRLAVMIFAALAACSGAAGAGDPDAGPDADTDADDETDTGEECECFDPAEVYCEDDCIKVRCDGCHYEVEDCCSHSEGSQEVYCSAYDLPWCTWLEIDPECLSESDSYCVDDHLLRECQVQDDIWDNYFEDVDCYDPASCPCGSGCEQLGVLSGGQCWCCEADAGEPDGG